MEKNLVADSLLEIEAATFEAQCAACSHIFEHPNFGDFGSYGRLLFCTEDGKRYVYFDGFSAVAEQLNKKTGSSLSDIEYARLADPVDGKNLTAGIRCPMCCSRELAYCEGKKIGSVRLRSATYLAFLLLQDASRLG
jgi:hypothetical protein